MGKLSKVSQGFALAGLLCLGSLQATKADPLPAGPVYSATINYMGTNDPTMIFGGAASVVETVTFSNIGGAVGIQIGTYPSSTIDASNNNDFPDVVFSPPNCTVGTTCLPTSSPFFAFLPSESSGLMIGGTNAAPTVMNGSGSYTGATDQLCVLNNMDNFNSCNTNQGTTTLSYLNGLFTLTDQSLIFTFTLAPVSTPEPSSLLTLGSGLLGLLGFGFRRKSIV